MAAEPSSPVGGGENKAFLASAKELTDLYDHQNGPAVWEQPTIAANLKWMGKKDFRCAFSTACKFLAALLYSLKVWKDDSEECPLLCITEMEWLLVLYSMSPQEEQDLLKQVKSLLRHAQAGIIEGDYSGESDLHGLSEDQREDCANMRSLQDDDVCSGESDLHGLSEDQRRACAIYLRSLENDDVLHRLVDALLRDWKGPEVSEGHSGFGFTRVSPGYDHAIALDGDNSREAKSDATSIDVQYNTRSDVQRDDEMRDTICHECQTAERSEITRLMEVRVEKRSTLGSGAFGDVKRGVYEGRAVPVKFWNEESEFGKNKGKEEKAKEIEREWKMMRRLGAGKDMDAHIVTSPGIYYDDELGPGIVMDWHGVSLKGLIERASKYPPDPTVVVEVALKLAASIQKIHDAGIVHGDLSARNVLVSVSDKGELVVKVCDFGHALCLHGKKELEKGNLPKPRLWCTDESYSKEADVFNYAGMCQEMAKKCNFTCEPFENVMKSCQTTERETRLTMEEVVLRLEDIA